MNRETIDALKELAFEEFNLTTHNPVFASAMRYLERHPEVKACGMAFDFSGTEPFVQLWTNIENTGQMSAWDRIMRNDHPSARCVVWLGEEVEEVSVRDLCSMLYLAFK